MATIGQSLTAPESGWNRYDNQGPGITYAGTWTSGTASGNYADTYTWSNTAGSSVSFKFKGTKLRIIADSNPGADSSVKITIDGVVDHYSQQSSNTLLQVLVFEKEGLSDSIHQVIIERQTGPTSLDAIDTDGSVVVPIGSVLATPQTGWTRIEETDDRIQYDSAWFIDTFASNSGGSQKYVNSGTHWIKFKFYGTKFRFIGNTNTDRTQGNVNTVVVDGVSKGGFSQYAANNAYKILNYETDSLPLGLHEVQITTSGIVGFDAIDIDGSMPILVGSVLTAPEAGWKRIDNTDPLIGYAGSWTSGDHAQASSATETYTTTTSSSVSFAFYGTKVRLIGSGYNTGSSVISVSIDGQAAQNVSQNSSTLKRQMLFYEKDGLTEGVHTVRITNGQSANMWFDAIDIDSSGYLVMQVGQQLSTPESGWRRYDDSFSEFSYKNVPVYTNSNLYYNNTLHYTVSTNKSKVSFSFFGTKIRFISPAWSGYSQTPNKVLIDGNSYSYTEYIPSGNLQQILLFEVYNLSNQIHTVEIIPPDGVPFAWDAIDIDSNGRLCHIDEVFSIENLTIGKRIRCHYQAAAGTIGTFSGLGKEMANFIPVTNPAIPNGDFYFIMCENINKKKILVADRNIQNGVSWNTLNTAGIINGVKPEIISNDTFTTSNISINGHVVSASEALSTYDAYKAFDGNFVNSSCWAIPPNKSGWLSYKYDNARKIVKYKIYPNGTNYTQAPKNWTFEGSNNGVNWIILDTQTNQTGWNGSGKSFSITNNQKFIYFRINISVFNGATDASSIGELQLFEEQEGYDFVIRLLTGGTSSTDRDNEWDKYIANSTLNNTITAGDNNIWNWNSIWSMTSTTNTNGSGNRSARGNSTAASSSYIDTSTVVSGNTGFRPVLVVEIFDLIKSFIKDSEGFKKWVSSTAAVIENVSLNKNVTATGFTSNISGNFSSVVDGIVTHDGTKYNYGNSLATTNTISTDNMIIDLGQIYTIGEIKARLAAGGDTQWNERADILCSQDNVTYTPYGYIRHTSAPLDVQLVNRTNNGEVKARYVKITNFMQGVGTYSRPTVDEIQVFSIVTPSVPASWQTVSTTLPSVDTFKNEGIRDLSILNRNSTIFSNTMETNGTLGQGKTFKSSINLKKLIEIINIKVE